jgi:PAS domain S-box-containing protein
MKEILNILGKSREKMIIPDGIVVISKENEIIVFNDAAKRITGFNEKDVISKNFRVLFKNSREEERYIHETLTDKRTFSNLSIYLTDKNGNRKNLLVSLNPILSEKNEILSAVMVFRDTREMLNMAEKLENQTLELIDQKNKLDAIFNSNIEGTFTIDDKWNITSFNVSAEKITGYKKNEAIGKKCWEIFKSNLCRNGCHMELTMEKRKPSIGNELEIINKNGKTVPIRVNSGILLNNRNEKTGAVETFIDITEIKNLSELLSKKYNFNSIIGNSREMQKIFSLLESISQSETTTLITGESGTGKELIAKSIHLNGSRKKGPFIAINCSAFNENLIESELFGHEKGAFTGADKMRIGKFELAQSGTLFLDEIGDLSLSIQTKLLRVLETGEFERVGGNTVIKMNARIITATNKNLSDEIKAGRFRDDFYYRINVINLHLPSLRERIDDFPLLINHFITQFNKKFNKKIKNPDSAVYDLMIKYSWPGNIRELENVIEHCFVLCSGEIIETGHLPERLKTGIDRAATSSSSLESAERGVILHTLTKNNGSRIMAAKELGINVTTLWRKMKKYGIKYTSS